MARKELEKAEKWAKEIWANADFALTLYNKGAAIEDIALVTNWGKKIVCRYIKMAQAFPEKDRTLTIPIDVYEVAAEYPNPQKAIKMAWEKNWLMSELKKNLERSHLPENPIQSPRKTPLEIALEIDDEGMTTARKLYAFLFPNDKKLSNYSKWTRKNIEQNVFTEEGTDFFPFVLQYDREISAFEAKQISRDYKLTSSFAKKLAMASRSPKGEQVRDYFIAIEQKVKAIANGEINPQLSNWILDSVDQFGTNMVPGTVKKLKKFAEEGVKN